MGTEYILLNVFSAAFIFFLLLFYFYIQKKVFKTKGFHFINGRYQSLVFSIALTGVFIGLYILLQTYVSFNVSVGAGSVFRISFIFALLSAITLSMGCFWAGIVATLGNICAFFIKPEGTFLLTYAFAEVLACLLPFMLLVMIKKLNKENFIKASIVINLSLVAFFSLVLVFIILFYTDTINIDNAIRGLSNNGFSNKSLKIIKIISLSTFSFVYFLFLVSMIAYITFFYINFKKGNKIEAYRWFYLSQVSFLSIGGFVIIVSFGFDSWLLNFQIPVLPIGGLYLIRVLFFFISLIIESVVLNFILYALSFTNYNFLIIYCIKAKIKKIKDNNLEKQDNKIKLQ